MLPVVLGAIFPRVKDGGLVRICILVPLCKLHYHQEPKPPSHPSHPDSACLLILPSYPSLRPPTVPTPGPRLPFPVPLSEHLSVTAEGPTTWLTGFTSNSWPQTSVATQHCQKSYCGPLVNPSSHSLRGAPRTLFFLPKHLSGSALSCV